MAAHHIRILALALVALTVTVPAAARAHGGDTALVHACVGVVGLTRIVAPTENCRPIERAVHWSITGPPGPPGGSAFRVVDVLGTQIGHVIGEQGPYLRVVLGVPDAHLLLTLTRTGYLGGGALYYVSQDCSGQAYIVEPATGFLTVPVVMPPDNVAFIPDPNDTPGQFVFGSRQEPTFPPGSCALNPPDQKTARKALPVATLNQIFTPPFTLVIE